MLTCSRGQGYGSVPDRNVPTCHKSSGSGEQNQGIFKTDRMAIATVNFAFAEVFA